MRSAGRVRLSDHPRETHPNISSARKYWGPRECPCRALHGTGARGPRLRAEKACGPQRRATRPCKPSCELLGCAIRQPAPAGVSRPCGAAMPNAGSGAGHDTLRHTSRAKPSILPPELFSLRSKAWALSGFGAAAWLPGSECAIPPHTISLRSIERGPRFSPCAYAVLLNKPSTCSVTVVFCTVRDPRQVAPPLVG